MEHMACSAECLVCSLPENSHAGACVDLRKTLWEINSAQVRAVNNRAL